MLQVMLELAVDASLIEAGLAREMVNKFQKMRKSAGLIAGQVRSTQAGKGAYTMTEVPALRSYKLVCA